MVNYNLAKKFTFLFITLFSVGASGGQYTFQDQGQSYSYSVVETGDNHTFEFTTNPGLESKKLKAALHVMKTVYEDDSIDPKYKDTFFKETALCFAFDSNFYTYRACFLPNDYSPNHASRFWGFVSRVPNATWLVTRNLLPALLFFGLLFFFPRRRWLQPGG